MAAMCMVLVGTGVFSGSFLGLRALAGPSATEVGDLINTDTTWTLENSPYIVTSSVLVIQGATLTIEPGVEMRFGAGVFLQVNGELIARGTDEATIVFTSNAAEPARGDWGNILFTDSSVETIYDEEGNYLSGSILEYCTIEFSGAGSGTTDSSVSSPPASSLTAVPSETSVSVLFGQSKAI